MVNNWVYFIPKSSQFWFLFISRTPQNALFSILIRQSMLEMSMKIRKIQNTIKKDERNPPR